MKNTQTDMGRKRNDFDCPTVMRYPTLVRTSIPIILLLLFCFFQVTAFFIPAWPKTHDGIFHAIRVKDYFQEVQSGQIPVRWVDTLDYGYGLPVFNYIYPGPYMLASLPMAITGNEVVSFKIIMILGYALGVIGIYVLFAKKNISIALASGILFGLTPYILLDVFVRGALAEIVAIGFMPWALFGFAERKYALGAVSLCLVVISHNYLGILFLLFLILLLFWTRDLNRRSGTAVILGIGLSAFFILPMIAESRYIGSGLGNGYAFDYQNHFVYPLQLLYSRWGFGYSVPGPKDGMSFQLGIANICIILYSCFAVFTVKNRSYVSCLLATVICSIFLTSIYSRFIWDQMKVLHGLTVFPWRLLFFPAFLCPILFGITMHAMHARHPVRAYFITIILIGTAFVNVRNYRQATEYIPFSVYKKMVAEEGQKTTTISRSEIAPIWSKEAKAEGERVADVRSNERIPSMIGHNSVSFSVYLRNQSNSITIRKNYFPGWKLENLSSGESMAVRPDGSGNATAVLPDGMYRYAYGQTTIEVLANLITVCCFVILILWSCATRKKDGLC